MNRPPSPLRPGSTTYTTMFTNLRTIPSVHAMSPACREAYPVVVELIEVYLVVKVVKGILMSVTI